MDTKIRAGNRSRWRGAFGFGIFALCLAWPLSITPVWGQQDTAGRPVTVFAAASTTDVINAVAAAFEAQGGAQVRPVYASSSTLARQITQGAPADLFLSANPTWLDFVAEKGFVQPGSRVDLLVNTLVLIAPARQPLEIAIEPGFAIERVIGSGRLAMGDPNHVPAGIYAKMALERLGVWARVEHRLAYAADVRAALALVERGEARAGIVYATDAAISGKVMVAGQFPDGSHPPIVYPLAIVAGQKRPEVEAFFRFLQGPEAAAIFRANGFGAPGAEG